MKSCLAYACSASFVERKLYDNDVRLFFLPDVLLVVSIMAFLALLIIQQLMISGFRFK